MRRLAALGLVALFGFACSGGGGQVAIATPTPVSAPGVLVPQIGNDQPAFPDRIGGPPELSLQELFHPTYRVPLDPSKIRTLLVTGDVIPARGVAYYTAQRKDYLWPFRPTAAYTRDADITYIDLEAPLFSGCPISPASSFTFCGDPRFVNGMTYMGADVANLANNHLTNWGAAGVSATDQLLTKNEIKSSGLGPVAVINVRGIKFGFIGFNGVGAAIDRIALKASIQRARQLADIVVVQFHWGKEYERQPKADPNVPTPDDPVQIGHLSIDWGADIVIGNHPHWYQGIEVYHGKLITYSHGNFVFDQMWSEATREGVIGTYTFYGTKLVAATWKPIRIYDFGQAVFMNEADSSNVLTTMEAASDQLALRLHEPTTNPVPAFPPALPYAPQAAPKGA